MSDSLDQLREMKAKLDLKWSRLQSQLAGVTTERDEIDTAIRVLERLEGIAAAQEVASTNENGTLILRHVGLGESEAQAPKDIQERLVRDGHDLSPDLVRTQLWRMAKRGLLESENGKYWKPQGSEPNQPRQEPDEDPWGEQRVDGIFGNAVRGGFADDLDDDVPF